MNTPPHYIIDLNIATDEGAAREQLDNGRAGILIPRDRPKSLAAEIRDLLAEPDRAKTLSRAALTRAAAWDATAVVPRWEQMLYAGSSGSAVSMCWS